MRIECPCGGTTLDNRAGAVHENCVAAQCPPRLNRMPHRIIFDGLNLSLAQGTGIATYTRMLTRVARDLGHDVGVVYSTPFTPPADALLREVAFFDAKRPTNPVRKKKLTARKLLNFAIDQARYQLPIKPMPVELGSAVITRQFNDALAVHDRAFVARNVFENARTYFFRTRAFAELVFEPSPDVLHCTYPLPLRVRSACNIYTIHDLVPLRLPFTTLDDKQYLFRLLKKIARDADHIVTVSENSKRDIIQLLGVEETRITNTYQAVAIPQQYIERPETVVANQLEGCFGFEMQGYLLYYGALEPKKNVGRLIEAYISSGVNLPLVLVIGGGWQNDAEIRLLAEQEARQSSCSRRRICRLEYVTYSTLVTLIRGARAVVFPSLYEGFGLPVLESMVLGTPVVASRESSVPEIAGDAALLVDPYDTDEIARAITTIVNDADLRAELSRRGPLQAAKFSTDRYRDRVAAMYTSLR